MPKPKQPPPVEDKQLPDFGLTPAQRAELIPLESRSDPEAETVSRYLGASVEVIHLYYAKHIVYPSPRKPSMTRGTVFGITHGLIERADPKDAA